MAPVILELAVEISKTHSLRGTALKHDDAGMKLGGDDIPS